MSGVLRVLSRLRHILNAPLVGASYMLAWLAWSESGPLVPDDELLLGRSASSIANFVAVRFAGEIRHIGNVLVATAIVVGAALGAFVLLLLELRARLAGAAPARTGVRAAFVGLTLVAWFHAVFLAMSMARWPQLYAPVFWGAGGALAALQRFVTDRLGPRGTSLVLYASVMLVVVGSPLRWTRIARTFRASRARRGALVVVGGVLVVVLGAGVATKAPAPAARRADARRRPNVVVLASDGLRADRLRPDVAPRLSAVADGGTRFDRAYVELPRTLSSWTSMLTGARAQHHGLQSGFPTWDEMQAVHDALPHRLRDAGYTTVAVSDYAGDVFHKADFGWSKNVAPKWDFAGLLWQRGIARATPLLPFLQTRIGRRFFPELADMSDASDPNFVADEAIDALREARDQPLFMVVFFSTTHFPYAAPAPYYRTFTDPAYDGPFRYEKQVTAGVPIIPSAKDETQIRALYDGAVAAVDAASGRILDELARLDLAEDTIVVVTSDHGEGLFEHGRWHGHGDHLFGDEPVHVPFAIRDPRTPLVRRENALVANVDFAPTILALTGSAPFPTADGRSLAGAVRGEPLASKTVYAETELWFGTSPGLPDELRLPSPPLFDLLEVDTDHGTMVAVRREAAPMNLVARHRMVRDDRFKLLYMPTAHGVEWRLFDLANDPEEQKDVLSAFPEEAARLRDELFDRFRDDRDLMVAGGRIVLRPHP